MLPEIRAVHAGSIASSGLHHLVSIVVCERKGGDGNAQRVAPVPDGQIFARIGRILLLSELLQPRCFTLLRLRR